MGTTTYDSKGASAPPSTSETNIRNTVEQGEAHLKQAADAQKNLK